MRSIRRSSRRAASYKQQATSFFSDIFKRMNESSCVLFFPHRLPLLPKVKAWGRCGIRLGVNIWEVPKLSKCLIRGYVSEK